MSWADKNNMQTQIMASEILINSSQVTRHSDGKAFEFILDENLQVIECVRLESLNQDIARPIRDSSIQLDGMLFELNHVRVNPLLDNTYIIKRLTDVLNQIGVRVSNQPRQNSMAVCFKPLGEISDNVRFYLNKEGKLVFLSPSMRPRLVYSQPKI